MTRVTLTLSDVVVVSVENVVVYYTTKAWILMTHLKRLSLVLGTWRLVNVRIWYLMWCCKDVVKVFFRCRSVDVVWHSYLNSIRYQLKYKNITMPRCIWLASVWGPVKRFVSNIIFYHTCSMTEHIQECLVMVQFVSLFAISQWIKHWQSHLAVYIALMLRYARHFMYNSNGREPATTLTIYKRSHSSHWSTLSP